MNTQEISTNLFQLLNGKDLASKQHEAMMLLTLSQDQWPHVAMISVGEVIAISSTELKLSLWPNTITTSNIIRNGKATLVIIFNGIAHYIKLSLRKLPELTDANISANDFQPKLFPIGKTSQNTPKSLQASRSN